MILREMQSTTLTKELRKKNMGEYQGDDKNIQR